MGLNRLTSSAEDASVKLAKVPRGSLKNKKRKDTNSTLASLDNICLGLGLPSVVGVSGEGLEVAPFAKSVGDSQTSRTTKMGNNTRAVKKLV